MPTVVRGVSETVTREIVLGEPAAQLRAYVRGYCGYFERVPGLTHRAGYPSSTVGLIFGFGPPVEIAFPQNTPDATTRATSFVAGLHDSYAVAASTEWQHGVQVDLTPIGAHMLFGVPMHSIANRIVDLDSLLGAVGVSVVDQLFGAKGWEARFDLLDTWIAGRLAVARPASPMVTRALSRLSETGGLLSIAALVRELGSSRQTLVRQFREEVGVPPKTLGRVLRFQRALRLLERHDELHLAAIAQECGYYDQSHFNRDFREFTGRAPSEHLARRRPDGAGVIRR